MTAPCKHLCGYDLKRFHFTCLTCPRRREANGKGSWKRYSKAHLILESPSGRGILLPDNYQTYGLTFSRDNSFFRRTVIKTLLTITERIAEW